MNKEKVAEGKGVSVVGTGSKSAVNALVMPLFVFRVQDKDGRGPWKPGFSAKWVVPRRDHDNLPPMYEEFKQIEAQMIPGKAVYGSACPTIKKLRRWFTKKEYAKLKQYGYHAMMMRVDNILAMSEVQLVFARSLPLNVGCRPVKLY